MQNATAVTVTHVLAINIKKISIVRSSPMVATNNLPHAGKMYPPLAGQSLSKVKNSHITLMDDPAALGSGIIGGNGTDTLASNRRHTCYTIR